MYPFINDQKCEIMPNKKSSFGYSCHELEMHKSIMGIKIPKTLKVQKVSPKIFSQLHEVVSEFFLLKASTIEFNL
jgi:hypothetical protein